jgi:hypothetical protein
MSNIEEQDPQEAVIADILSKTVVPSESGDLASISLLEATDDGAVYIRFHKYGYTELSDSSLSDVSMDCLCAAWIDWRKKHYKAAPTGTEQELGDIENRPF